MMGVGAKRALGLYRSCAPRQDDAGKGKVGAVMIQEEQIFTARDVGGSVDLSSDTTIAKPNEFLDPPTNPAAIT